MSYSYLFIRLPFSVTRIADLNLSELAQVLEPITDLQAKLSSLFNDTQWFTTDGSIFGQVVRTKYTAEFILGSPEPDKRGFGFSGPREWVPIICKEMGLFCYDPQIAELWTPEGECISLQR
jgi:hypothetical protein